MRFQWVARLRLRFFQWLFSLAAKSYFFLKPKVMPLITRSPRMHRAFFFFKEAGKALLQPHPVAPPIEASFEKIESLEPQAGAKADSGRLPAWLTAEWKAMHHIDPEVFPTPDLVAAIPFYEVPYSLLAEPYLELCEVYGQGVTHVYLVPWLVQGGADLVTVNTVRALLETAPDAQAVVIATLDAKSVWRNRLPKTARFIEFGRKYGFLPVEQQEKLLTRLLLQTGPRVIHNINSELGYGIFAKYGAALAQGSSLYASSFCGDRSPEGRRVGYPFGPLNDCFDHLTAVITDNQAHIEDMIRLYGMDRRKFFRQYQPAPAADARKGFDERFSEKKRLDVLWAGRLDRQKRPDILMGVAEACRDLPVVFHVFGSSVMEQNNYAGRFKQIENIVFHGPFDGLTSLNPDTFDLFLNTSQWEGLPNILLEAIRMGLPVISSAVGGIPELVRDGESGFLVSPFDNIPRYRSLLESVLEDRRRLVELSRAAETRLAEHHDWAGFVTSIAEIPGYL